MSQINVNTIANASGTSAASIDSNGILTPTKIAQSVAFQVRGSDSDFAYIYTNGPMHLTGWNVIDLNVGNCWSSANQQFTPTVAGWYMFGGNVRFQSASTVAYISIEITKNNQFNNGTGLKTQYQYGADTITNSEFVAPSGLLYCNGSTDYVEMFIDCDENITVHDSSVRESNFFGFLVHAT